MTSVRATSEQRIDKLTMKHLTSHETEHKFWPTSVLATVLAAHYYHTVNINLTITIYTHTTAIYYSQSA